MEPGSPISDVSLQPLQIQDEPLELKSESFKLLGEVSLLDKDANGLCFFKSI